MYSGTTFHGKSGRIMGVHQRVDRIARRSLKLQAHSLKYFPSIKDILHFEGKNGPDGIKRKSPGIDEPWHFIDPSSPKRSGLLETIEDHIQNLAEALRAENRERAAFEAAWLAHAVTDGLTPAHHYPFDEKLAELRGSDADVRRSVREKIIIPGRTRKDQLVKNWKYWGARGVAISHFGFEHGVATIVSSQKIQPITIHPYLYADMEQEGYVQIFLQALDEIASLNMYDEYLKKGWTRQLARQTRETLMPAIVRTVLLAWCEAVRRSET